MPRRPASSGYKLSIDDDFDESRNYLTRLDEIEERPSQFADSKSETSLVWKFNIYRQDGTAFMDPRTGLAFELWAWTSDSTWRTAKARGYIDALMGHETTDEEVDDLIDNGFGEVLAGKIALGSFEVRTNADGNERLHLALLRPHKARARSAPVAVPDPEPEPEAAVVAPMATPPVPGLVPKQNLRLDV